eukprot:TRINITY_DN60_c5_g1_i1.p1 TRINITY_DN60_c5_g1~~TRINITY_DN60_c5_g1_i1.p1  ORF type:complete len:343 (+),score=69.60 TRINITY_DN60_c5_g1_i1:46-1029(+)
MSSHHFAADYAAFGLPPSCLPICEDLEDEQVDHRNRRRHLSSSSSSSSPSLSSSRVPLVPEDDELASLQRFLSGTADADDLAFTKEFVKKASVIWQTQFSYVSPVAPAATKLKQSSSFDGARSPSIPPSPPRSPHSELCLPDLSSSDTFPTSFSPGPVNANKKRILSPTCHDSFHGPMPEFSSRLVPLLHRWCDVLDRAPAWEKSLIWRSWNAVGPELDQVYPSFRHALDVWSSNVNRYETSISALYGAIGYLVRRRVFSPSQFRRGDGVTPEFTILPGQQQRTGGRQQLTGGKMSAPVAAKSSSQPASYTASAMKRRRVNITSLLS